MSREDILEYYTKFEKKWSDNKDTTRIVSFNDDLEIKVKDLIDSLKMEKIDTLLIYSVSFPGYMYSDRACVDISYPIDIYVYWKQGVLFNEKRILNGCDLEIEKVDSCTIVNFFMDNYEHIKDEKIMPVIYSAVLNPDSTMNYSSGTVSHEPKYSIYMKYGNDYSQKIFTDNDITNQESLFYNYNMNLKTYRLFNLIDTRINERNTDK
jgi:hypothetical protein